MFLKLRFTPCMAPSWEACPLRPSSVWLPPTHLFRIGLTFPASSCVIDVSTPDHACDFTPMGLSSGCPLGLGHAYSSSSVGFGVSSPLGTCITPPGKADPLCSAPLRWLSPSGLSRGIFSKMQVHPSTCHRPQAQRPLRQFPELSSS